MLETNEYLKDKLNKYPKLDPQKRTEIIKVPRDSTNCKSTITFNLNYNKENYIKYLRYYACYVCYGQCVRPGLDMDYYRM